jgi:NAD+ synthase (glutamine-hydrolysing)
MGRLVTLATCSLNQWVLDWIGNADRIIESVRRAKLAGAMLRVGPELEITGYGCLDHFLESDTFLHAWEMLAKIIAHPDCQDIVVDVGMPVRHRNCRYNARVIFYNKKIILIRPKSSLANDGNYREMRYFTPWLRERYTESYYLESVVAEITGQRTVPFGDAIISTLDTAFAAETCEELFTPSPPHIPLGLDGCEIFTNSSGSHFEIRKILRRLTLIREATQQNKGIYLYANQQGCDGDRLYYDGCAMILVNGKVVAQGSQFSLNDVEVVTATVDLEEVRAARFAPSRGMQVQKQEPYPRIDIDVALSAPKSGPSPLKLGPSTEISLRASSPPEEIAQCCAMWLWDYLRRCGGAAGYFIALSGGIDSCATATLVFSMCRMVYDAIHSESTDPMTREQVIVDCRRICDQPADSTWLPSSPQDICSRIFHTSFMGTVNSSTETRSRAKDLAKAIGAYHIDCDIDSIVSALTTFFSTITSFTPRFKQNGGSPAEGLALQNIQARLRMVVSYLFAQLLPTVRKRKAGGGLLVLGSANVDEQLRGYLTKYDCSSADINPIGGISKTDLKAFIAYARDEFDMPILNDFLEATPTAELEPISDTYVQSDEADMGMTYAELSVFGRLRKVHKLGIWGMYEKLVYLWGKPAPAPSAEAGEKSLPDVADEAHGAIQGRGLSPQEVYEKVRRFFYYFNVNRHKATILPPGLHLEEYSPEDNRFDLRPFLYPQMAGSWPIQKIEDHVRKLDQSAKAID